MPRPLVVTFGEAMLRLSAPRAQPLRLAAELSVHVGGSEANVAAGLAGLGFRARWFSAVAEGELGERVLGELARHGVDTSFVKRGPGRTGLYFFEEGIGTRPASVVYDRAGSAFTLLSADDAEQATAAGLLAGAAAFVTSGISLALGEGPRAAAAALWREAGAAGALRVLDVNYRSRLASPAEAAAQVGALLPTADLLFVAERDLVPLFGGLEHLRSAAAGATIVITQGAAGATSLTASGEARVQPALPAADEGRLGRGDAFLAGHLAAGLDGAGPAAALAMGVACASLKSTLAGDLAVLDRSQAEALAAVAATRRADGGAGAGDASGRAGAHDVRR